MIKQKWINVWMNKRWEISSIEAIQAIFNLASKTRVLPREVFFMIIRCFERLSFTLGNFYRPARLILLSNPRAVRLVKTSHFPALQAIELSLVACVVFLCSDWLVVLTLAYTLNRKALCVIKNNMKGSFQRQTIKSTDFLRNIQPLNFSWL